MSVVQANALARCFDETCSCDPVNSPTACTVEDFPSSKAIHITGAFSSSLKRSGSIVTFSLSGFTIPDDSVGASPSFTVKTRWYTDFTSATAPEGFVRSYYDIDSYLGFSLTITAAT